MDESGEGQIKVQADGGQRVLTDAVSSTDGGAERPRLTLDESRVRRASERPVVVVGSVSPLALVKLDCLVNGTETCQSEAQQK